MRGSSLVCLLFVLLVSVLPPACSEAARPIEGLDSLASATLSRALGQLGIRHKELGFDKLYAEDDTFRLNVVERLLNDPLKIPGWQAGVVEQARYAVTDPATLVEFLGELCEAQELRVMSFYEWPPHFLEHVLTKPTPMSPERWREAFRPEIDAFIEQCRDAETWLSHAFEDLSAEERATLLTLAPAFWGDWEHPADLGRKGALHFELGAEADTTIEISEHPVLDAAVKVNRSSLTHAAEIFQMAWVDLSRALARSTLPEAARDLDGASGAVIAIEETPWGLLVIGGPDANTYSETLLRSVAFLLDPGGDDVYRGRAASAVGGLLRPFAALIDMAGDDLYDAGARSYALGGAVLGIATLIDLEGRDVYRGDDGCLGAGFFGAGFLYDGDGRDFFEGRNLSQGAGAFGIGALISDARGQPPPAPEPEIDRAFAEGLVKVPGTGAVPVRFDANDTYVCARSSQGFASTFGVGLLYDKTGNDTYRSGGYYLHAPLRPHDFQSLSQGFSIGFRPRAAGGIGILIDEEGNDFYSSEVYAQGASYWYSIGLLYDQAGNDRYHATQYAQGAGVHLAIGSLWDVGGDDQYVSQFGVTQGTAHDLSAGWFLDEGGNDYYCVSDGQGISITNSVGVFIDSQGDDLYATVGPSQGTSNWARGFCGSGIFLDLEGRDRYPSGAAGADGAAWSQEVFSIGIDLDRDVQLPDEVIPEPILTAEDSLRAVEELFETASIWEVGSAREKVRRARLALIAKGTEAIDYVVAEKLATDDGLEYRAILSLAEAYPDSFTARILPHLDDENEKVVGNVVHLLGDLEREDAAEPLGAMLHDPERDRHWTRIIWALGEIGDQASASVVRPFLEDDQERRRLSAVVALAALQDTASVEDLVLRLDDPILTVRAAATRAVESFRTAAVGPLTQRLSEDPRGRRLIIASLGGIAAALQDSTDAVSLDARSLARRTLMEQIEHACQVDDVSCRAAAAEALLDFGDQETADFVRLRLKDDSDPLVRRLIELEREEER